MGEFNPFIGRFLHTFWERMESSVSKIEDFEMLDERIVRAVREMGFETLSPIQEQAIPFLLEGEDIIGQAQTGTGKTAAFGIPVLQKTNPEVKKLQTVILCPTRELAIQASEKWQNICTGLRCFPSMAGRKSESR